MAQSRLRISLSRFWVPIVLGSTFGMFLGFATAQETGAGWLNNDCAGRCIANGYEGEFCQNVCWVPDPGVAAEGDNLDWKCMETCGARGGTTRSCLASCRRY